MHLVNVLVSFHNGVETKDTYEVKTLWMQAVNNYDTKSMLAPGTSLTLHALLHEKLALPAFLSECQVSIYKVERCTHLPLVYVMEVHLTLQYKLLDVRVHLVFPAITFD